MTFTEVISGIAVQTTANIISNLVWFILIYWSVKTITKNVPEWLEQYEKVKKEQRAIDYAVRGLRG